MSGPFDHFAAEESGQSLVEYTLVFVVIALGVVAALNQIPAIFINQVIAGTNYVWSFWPH